MALRRLMFYLLLFWVLPLASFGQQTVFDVPSADVLDRGKVYGELDLTFRSSGLRLLPRESSLESDTASKPD